MKYQLRDVAGEIIHEHGEKLLFQTKDDAKAHRADYGIGAKIEEVQEA